MTWRPGFPGKVSGKTAMYILIRNDNGNSDQGKFMKQPTHETRVICQDPSTRVNQDPSKFLIIIQFKHTFLKRKFEVRC